MSKCENSIFNSPVTHIFNLTFVTGKIPDQLKMAIVGPVFKSGDKHKTIDQYQFSHVLLNCLKN